MLKPKESSFFWVLILMLAATPQLWGQFGKADHFFAQMAIGAGAESVITVNNPGEEVVRLTLDVYRNDGTVYESRSLSLTGRSTRDFRYGEEEPELIVGWARLQGDRNFNATLFYEIAGVGNVGVLSSRPSEAFQLVSVLTEGTDTGFAVANPSESEDVTVTFRKYSPSGGFLGTGESVLSPLSQKAFFVSEEPISAQEGGLVEVNANGRVVATALRVDGGLLSGTGLVGSGDALRVQENEDSPSLIGGYEGNSIAEGIPGSVISGGGRSGQENEIFGEYAVIGGGRGHEAGAPDQLGAVVSGGLSNRAVGNYSTVSGGSNNEATGQGSSVAGGDRNLASGTGAAVGAGGVNQALGAHSFVAGFGNVVRGGSSIALGSSHDVTGPSSGVLSGSQNLIDGANSVIAGGRDNRVEANSAAVLAGSSNEATGPASVISGGGSNVASGSNSAIPGGSENRAEGWVSFAAGHFAHALHDGSFVWSDRSTSPLGSTNPNQFLARASGGFFLYTNSDDSAGVELPQGSGSWSTLSDMEAKEAFEHIDPRSILAGVASLPIQAWRYKSQPGEVRHLGPTAQDFRRVFQLGGSAKTISTVDADGVALAAIQGLYQEMQEKNARIERLQKAISDLEAVVMELR